MRKNWKKINAARYLIEKENEYPKWQQEIPYINFPSSWLIKAIPPYNGAIICYNIKHKNYASFVSIYLDCYDELGIMGQPYWEIYPIKDDCYRCYLNEVDSLLSVINQSLIEQKRRINIMTEKLNPTLTLFHLSQNENTSDDTFDSMVVAAKDIWEAISMHPYMENSVYIHEDWADSWSVWASTPLNVTATPIGTTNKYSEATIIITSFNAG